jgi:hypothetical protein
MNSDRQTTPGEASVRRASSANTDALEWSTLLNATTWDPRIWDQRIIKTSDGLERASLLVAALGGIPAGSWSDEMTWPTPLVRDLTQLEQLPRATQRILVQRSDPTCLKVLARGDATVDLPLLAIFRAIDPDPKDAVKEARQATTYPRIDAVFEQWNASASVMRRIWALGYSADHLELRIAEHQFTPDDILIDLAADPRRDVRIWLTERTELPLAVHEILALDDDADVRREFAVRHAWDLETAVAARMSRDRSTVARDAVLAAHGLDYRKDLLDEFRVLSEREINVEPYKSRRLARETMDWTDLARLAASGDPVVRRRVASRPGLPIDVLNALSINPDSAVFHAIAATQPVGTVMEWLERAQTEQPDSDNLASRIDQAARTLSERDDLDSAAMTRMADSPLMPPGLRLAERPDLPAEVAALLAEHRDARVREALAEQPDIRDSDVVALISDHVPAVGHAASLAHFDRQDTPALARAIASAALGTRVAVALDSRIESTPFLTTLVSDPESVVRLALARRPNLAEVAQRIDPTLVTRLAKDPDTDVRCAMACRRDLDRETVAGLAADEDTAVPLALIAATPAEEQWDPVVVAVLAESTDPAVRESLAQSPKIPRTTVRLLATDAESSVRRAIAGRANTPEDILAAFASDEDPDVRTALAGNDGTPPHTLAALATDADDGVRIAAIGHRRTPADAIERASANARDSVVDAIRSRKDRDALKALRELGLRQVAQELATRSELGDEVLDWLFGEFVIGTPPGRMSFRGTDIRHISSISLVIAENKALLSSLTPSQQLDLLAWHDGEWVDIDGVSERKGDRWAMETALAKNASVLGELVLRQIVESGSYRARSALVRNAPDLFDQIIAELEFDEHPAVREAFEKRKRRTRSHVETTRGQLERTGAPMSTVQLAKGVKPNDISNDDLADLVHSRYEEVTAAVAANRDLIAVLNLDQQMYLARLDALPVAKALAENADVLEGEAVSELARSRFYVARRILASQDNDALTPQAFALLSQDPDDQVRRNLGGGAQSTPPVAHGDVASIISRGDKDDLVDLIGDDSALAELTADQQVAIAKHRSVDVPRALARKAPLLCAEAHAALASSTIFTARRELVRTAGTIIDPALLEQLANDDDEVVQRMARSIRDKR